STHSAARWAAPSDSPRARRTGGWASRSSTSEPRNRPLTSSRMLNTAAAPGSSPRSDRSATRKRRPRSAPSGTEAEAAARWGAPQPRGGGRVGAAARPVGHAEAQAPLRAGRGRGEGRGQVGGGARDGGAQGRGVPRLEVGGGREQVEDGVPEVLGLAGPAVAG